MYVNQVLNSLASAENGEQKTTVDLCSFIGLKHRTNVGSSLNIPWLCVWKLNSNRVANGNNFHSFRYAYRCADLNKSAEATTENVRTFYRFQLTMTIDRMDFPMDS